MRIDKGLEAESIECSDCEDDFEELWNVKTLFGWSASVAISFIVQEELIYIKSESMSVQKVNEVFSN